MSLEPAPISRAHRQIATVALIVATAMQAGDATMVNVALHPQERHGRLLAIWGSAIMLGPILGPVIGGIVTDFASWRWVFAVHLPLGVLAIWGMRWALPRGETVTRTPIDAIGALVLMIGIGSLQLLLSRGVGRSWLTSPELLCEATATVAGFGFLALRARTLGFTVLRLAVFKDLHFAGADFY